MDHLTRKRTIHEENPQCHCERLIQVVLAECQCSDAPRPSVFERLSWPPSQSGPSRWRRRRQKRRAADDLELPIATINMAGKGKARYSSSSDPEFSPGVNWPPVECEGVYQFTRTQTGVAIPFDYARLSRIYDNEDEVCSATVTSQTSSSAYGKHVRVHVAEASEDLAKRIEEQEATINSLKQMMEQLLNKKKEKRAP